MPPEVDFIKRVGSNGANGYTITETYGVRDTANNACNLGPITVMNLAGIPKMGSSYNPPNACDTADSTIFVNSVNVSDPQSDNVHCWVTVTVGYTQPDQDTPKSPKPHPQHNTDEDPVNWKPEIVVRKQPVVKALSSSKFLGAYQVGSSTLVALSNGVVNMPLNSEQPIQNAAGIRSQEQATEEQYDQLIEITTYAAEWDPNFVFGDYDGAVNNGDVAIVIPEWNYNRVFSKYHLKMGAITGVPGYREWRDNTGTKHSRTFWRVTYPIMFRKTGWYSDVDNSSLVRVYRDNSNPIPDGIGGTLTAADFAPGTAWTGPITEGRDKLAITEPVAIGLDGQPLAGRTAPYRLRYLDGVEADWLNPDLGAPFQAPTP